MMKTSVVTVKGQIVIPVALRRKAGLKKGTRVYLEEKDGDIIVHLAGETFYDQSFGLLKGGKLTDALVKERRKDRKREESRFAKT